MDHRTHSLQDGVAVVTGAGGGGVGQEALVEEDARYLGRGDRQPKGRHYVSWRRVRAPMPHKASSGGIHSSLASRELHG